MTITAEQAAKLLEGTTPGPWTVETGNVPIADTGDYDGYCRLMAGGRIIFEQWGDDEQSEKDANLAGAAPDLARALIASEAARKLAEERLAGAAAALCAAEKRSKENWNKLRRLWDLAKGWDPEDDEEGPFCRDCADEDGRCPHSGFPCDPQEAAEERISETRARLATAEERLAKVQEGLSALDKAAGEVARNGAVTGPQWTRLAIAMLKTRAILKEIDNG